jgi:hypothetical protein
MSSAQVIRSTIDISQRVPGFPGVAAGIVIPAARGGVDKLELITDENDLLNRLTANGKIEIGYDTSYWSALAFLASANRLYVARAANAALYGGAIIKSSPSANPNEAVASGMTDPLAYSFSGTPIVANAEETTFTCSPDVNGNLDGTYIEFSSPTVDYYLWFAVDTLWTTVTATTLNSWVVPTVIKYDSLNNALMYKAIDIGSAPHKTGVLEPTWPTTIGDTVVDGDITWQAFAMSSHTTDPAVTGKTGIQVTIPTNAVGSAIATRMEVMIDLLTGIFSSTAASATIAIVNAVDGTIYTSPTVGNTGWTTFPIVTSEGTDASTEEDAFLLYAVNPGDWNNDISVQIYNWKDSPETVREPNAFIIAVYYNSILQESHVCSMVEGTKDGYGNNIFVEDILQSSNYIRAYSSGNGLLMPKEQLVNLTFEEGDDGSTVTDGDMLTALDLFENTNDSRITILMDGGWTTKAYQRGIDAVCQSRQDCVGILSTRYVDESNSSYMTEILNYRKYVLNMNSSWCAMYSSHVSIYDKYNDRELYVSPDGYAAGVISRTFANYELWYPAAGFRRGLINVLDVKRRWSQGEMDELYDNQINPIKFAPGRGILIWGQKTLTTRPTALDRLNVRLLLVYIQPAIAELLEDFIFEFNDAITRNQIKVIIDDYMENIKTRRGVYAYQTVCDESNNTPVVIDANEMEVWLYIQPTKSAEIIRFKTILTRTGSSFEAF